jgi:predicted NBD/HSP70 family sugar kinase
MESYCSLRGLTDRIFEEYQAAHADLPEEFSQVSDRNIQFMSDVVVWGAEEARRGNVILKKIFDDAAYYLGVGIANIVSLFNPKYVILTGEMLAFQDLILEQTTQTANQMAWSLSKFQIIISDEDRFRASTGAALYFINNAFNSLDSKLLEL